MCFGEDPTEDLKKLRGLDRAPTAEEAAQPPDKRPWTEYDMEGNKQGRPPFKACHPHLCICCGPVWCVFECQWCKACGHDADRTCDIICRCQSNRMKMFICCGPQRDDPVKWCDCCLCCFGPKGKPLPAPADPRTLRFPTCACGCGRQRRRQEGLAPGGVRVRLHLEPLHPALRWLPVLLPPRHMRQVRRLLPGGLPE